MSLPIFLKFLETKANLDICERYCLLQVPLLSAQSSSAWLCQSFTSMGTLESFETLDLRVFLWLTSPGGYFPWSLLSLGDLLWNHIGSSNKGQLFCRAAQPGSRPDSCFKTCHVVDWCRTAQPPICVVKSPISPCTPLPRRTLESCALQWGMHSQLLLL
jgi:hypothetical protein